MKKEEVKIGGVYQLSSSSIWACKFGMVGVKVRVLEINGVDYMGAWVKYLDGRLAGATKRGYNFKSLEPVTALTTKQLVQKLLSKC